MSGIEGYFCPKCGTKLHEAVMQGGRLLWCGASPDKCTSMAASFGQSARTAELAYLALEESIEKERDTR